MAQAIFKSWFVDFEPFGGVIPGDWHGVPLAAIANFTSGYSYSSNDLKASATAMATIKNFERKGGFKINGFKEIEVTKKIRAAQYATQFDVLVAHTDLTQNADVIGNAEMLMSLGGYEAVILSLDLVKVEPTVPYITNFVLLSFLKSAKFKSHALGYVNGTTVLHLSKKALPEFTVMLPNNKTVLTEISALIEPMYRHIAENINENIYLATLRDTLLPRLMSGELSIMHCD